MFDLAMPWWEFVGRAMVVYVVLLVMVRVSGKRTIGQFTAFDMVLLSLLGNAVQNSLIGDDSSLPGGLILAGSLIALNFLVGWCAARSPWFQVLVEGKPVQILHKGVLDEIKLRRESVTMADFEEALRMAGIEQKEQALHAWIETDGGISIIRRERD